MEKINKKIIEYFETSLHLHLCKECYYNVETSLDEFQRKSIFNFKFDYTKVIFLGLLFSISYIISAPTVLYLIDVILFTLWAFDPVYFHINNSFFYKLKFVGYSVLHLILPNRKERVNEIIAFLHNNRPPRPALRTHNQAGVAVSAIKRVPKIQIRFKYQNVDLENNESAMEFCENFNKEYSKGLVRYIKERYKNNQSKTVDAKFLLALIMTPNRKKISFETLQFLSTLIYHSFGSTKIDFNSLDFDPLMDGMFFEEYSEQQLKRLFSTVFSSGDIIAIQKNKDIVAPVFSNFEELMNFVNKIHIDFQYPKKFIENNTFSFQKNDDFYKIQLVTNVNFLVALSKKLSNCLSSKESACLYGNYMVFEIMKNNDVYGAVAFILHGNDIFVSEIKGKANQVIPDGGLIENNIMQYYNKTIPLEGNNGR